MQGQLPSEKAGRAASPKAPTYQLGTHRVSDAGSLLKNASAEGV
jgi:hypothetical protein